MLVDRRMMRAQRRLPPCLIQAIVVVAIVASASFGGVASSWLSGLAAPGDSRADPIPLGDEGSAGPWRLRVLEVVTGLDATELVTAAAPTNDPPRDGATYVAVRIAARNTSDQSLIIDGNDFAITGRSGLVRRFVGATPPEPALDGAVEAGASREGWIVLGESSDEEQLLLLFDSTTLDGAWADRVFALEDGASVPPLGTPVAQPNEIGVAAASPAGIGEPIVTTGWEIELLEVVSGAAVFELVDYRTGALGPGDADDWVALRIRITNTEANGEPAFLPPNAFILADESGEPLNDIATLTPPDPDASGAYYPGASREGWVAFELPLGYSGTLVRFLPYATGSDPRYLTFG